MMYRCKGDGGKVTIGSSGGRYGASIWIVSQLVTVLARVYIVGRAFLGIVVVLPAAHRVRILVLIVAGVLDIGRLMPPVVVVALIDDPAGLGWP